MIKEPKEALALRGSALKVSDEARDALAEEGYDPKFGARPLRRTIQRRVEDTLADLWLNGDIAGAKEVLVDVAPKGSEAFEKGENTMTDQSGCYLFSWGKRQRVECLEMAKVSTKR